MDLWLALEHACRCAIVTAMQACNLYGWGSPLTTTGHLFLKFSFAVIQKLKTFLGVGRVEWPSSCIIIGLSF